MEWLKNMSLKKSFIVLTAMSFSVALLLSALVFWGCIELRSTIASEGMVIDVHADPVLITQMPAPTASHQRRGDILSILQFLLPALIFAGSMLLASSLFYRCKLKEPLTVLTASARRIMDNDLSFTVDFHADDELGQLCQAFELMRQALADSNQTMWRQVEERQRLNAAFAHDLRNPVTVLKGTARLMQQGSKNNALAPALLAESLTRMEEYSERIERYVEVMSSAQRLEQVPVTISNQSFKSIASELEETVSLLSAGSGVKADFQLGQSPGYICIDKSILFQIMENLLANALRFAAERVRVELTVEDDMLIMHVADDGSGFSETLLKKGVQPFQKGGEETEHLGMGLYICQVLCQKHGGSLDIGNGHTGAWVRAKIQIAKLE